MRREEVAGSAAPVLADDDARVRVGSAARATALRHGVLRFARDVVELYVNLAAARS